MATGAGAIVTLYRYTGAGAIVTLGQEPSFMATGAGAIVTLGAGAIVTQEPSLHRSHRYTRAGFTPALLLAMGTTSLVRVQG